MNIFKWILCLTSSVFWAWKFSICFFHLKIPCMTFMWLFNCSRICGRRVCSHFFMETDTKGSINLKTMKKADGTFPSWLSQRKVKQVKKKQKMILKAKKKKAKRNR
ncbi:hypothetical protein Tcan_11526 [Toxocara canis]|uniref:Uncharacterized protein n=1 Tax=Toxocara canis TaxID=6265 RepID=A0A0B2V325_TOXCA|nr:hypothetical protein Tcan_11526 [Toxocara canis]